MPPPPSALASSEDVQELAVLCRKGLIRDCEIDGEFLEAGTRLLARSWKEQLRPQSTAPAGKGTARKGPLARTVGWGSGPPPVTVTGVAPWAMPMSKGGLPATVAPWAKSKGAVSRSLLSAAPPEEEPAKDATLERAVAAAEILCHMVAAPEAVEAVAGASEKLLGQVLSLGELLARVLCDIGSNTGDGQQQQASTEHCSVLRTAVYQIYLAFPRCRRGLREAMIKAAVGTVQRAGQVTPQVMGVRLGCWMGDTAPRSSR
eukprot:TRINITY_DN32960_c0_g1_i1.p1 TRINITY_DN32960_c0_g1~~TRINITY_DN32960_c0_g1_i1.p1  ORF type:complete len:260 (-),score=76.53 TRINITY_DN32960_c0_g1_i1:109-888(-)